MGEIEAGTKLDARVGLAMGEWVVSADWPCHMDWYGSYYVAENYQEALGTRRAVYIPQGVGVQRFEDGSYGYEAEGDSPREIFWPPQPDEDNQGQLYATGLEVLLPYSTEWLGARYFVTYAVKRGYSFHCDIESETAVTAWFNKGANFRGRYEDSATGYGTSLPHAAALAFLNIEEFGRAADV
jgi:hypothetical protein